MYNTNPYYQAGWQQDLQASAWTSGTVPAPQSPQSPISVTTFFFTSFNPDIRNCTVVGPNNQPCFTIATDAGSSGMSVIRRANQALNQAPISIVSWTDLLVEVAGMVPRQVVSNWLPLASDMRYVALNTTCYFLNSPCRTRQMIIHGVTFTWVPRQTHVCVSNSSNTPRNVSNTSTQLYSPAGPTTPPELLARVSRSPDGTAVALELCASALNMNLLEPCVTAVLLLQSGRSID